LPLRSPPRLRCPSVGYGVEATHVERLLGTLQSLALVSRLIPLLRDSCRDTRRSVSAAIMNRAAAWRGSRHDKNPAETDAPAIAPAITAPVPIPPSKLEKIREGRAARRCGGAAATAMVCRVPMPSQIPRPRQHRPHKTLQGSWRADHDERDITPRRKRHPVKKAFLSISVP
jgi:hypothetical protein